MKELGLKDTDISESFILGSGKGGQKQNKTHNCVQLKHIPTGLMVTCQQRRERELNRFLARRQLCELIESQTSDKKTPKALKIEKIKKQKKRRKRRNKDET